MEWRRSGARSVMQIADAQSPTPYMMDVTWYDAPTGAKRFPGINAFVSGVWDRDRPELPTDLGEQPPYNTPYYGGKNVWGYLGKCFVGTLKQFELGLSAADIAVDPKPLPLCCAGGPPINPPYFDCPWYPLGIPSLLVLVASGDFGPFPEPSIAGPEIMEYGGFCTYTAKVPDNAPLWSNALWVIEADNITSVVRFISGTPNWTLEYHALRVDQPLPIVGPFIVATGTPPADFTFSQVTIYSYPYNPMTQTIQLAGDVIGSADLGPTGCLIVNTLVDVVVAGTAGDSTHVAQITWDAKGRILAATSVAIASSGVAIGNPVSGGTPTELLFTDAGGNLGQQSNFQAIGQALVATGNIAGITYTCQIGATGAGAGLFEDGTHQVSICDGANNVTYGPGNAGDWSGAAPTDVWIALDRLAAYLATVGGGPVP